VSSVCASKCDLCDKVFVESLMYVDCVGLLANAVYQAVVECVQRTHCTVQYASRHGLVGDVVNWPVRDWVFRKMRTPTDHVSVPHCCCSLERSITVACVNHFTLHWSTVSSWPCRRDPLSLVATRWTHSPRIVYRPQRWDRSTELCEHNVVGPYQPNISQQFCSRAALLKYTR